MSGIEGRFVAQAHEGDITLQINRLHASGHASVGEKSRSDLTQDSSATASKGSIFAQIAPSVSKLFVLYIFHLPSAHIAFTTIQYNR